MESEVLGRRLLASWKLNLAGLRRSEDCELGSKQRAVCVFSRSCCTDCFTVSFRKVSLEIQIRNVQSSQWRHIADFLNVLALKELFYLCYWRISCRYFPRLYWFSVLSQCRFVAELVVPKFFSIKESFHPGMGYTVWLLSSKALKNAKFLGVVFLVFPWA